MMTNCSTPSQFLRAEDGKVLIVASFAYLDTFSQPDGSWTVGASRFHPDPCPVVISRCETKAEADFELDVMFERLTGQSYTDRAFDVGPCRDTFKRPARPFPDPFQDDPINEPAAHAGICPDCKTCQIVGVDCSVCQDVSESEEVYAK